MRARVPRWIFWLCIGLLAAVAAEISKPFVRSAWVSLIWVLPALMLISGLTTALWRLLGSRRMVAPAGGRRLSPEKRPRKPTAHLQQMRRSGNYWAVVMSPPPETACQAALEHRDKLFDLYRVPQLPLDGCSQRRCKCAYTGLKNRRRRNVLPPGRDKDRRAGAVISWPGSSTGSHLGKAGRVANPQRTTTPRAGALWP